MGLAAGQARLLTITGRKSDCEFQSMRLSHQKIALARELADISNEYQNSLNQTKLIYDYYGTGDTSTQLSYGILMTPSALNDYMPTTITDSLGRVVLNSKYASVAAAAGIPREGLGTLPSENLRNAFVGALYKNGIITEKLSNTIQSLPYNQQAGFGGGATVALTTAEVSLNELSKYFQDYSTQPLQVDGINGNFTEAMALFDFSSNKHYPRTFNGCYLQNSLGTTNNGDDKTQISLKDILDGNFVLMSSTGPNATSTIGNAGGAIDAIVNSPVWEAMFSATEDILGIDEYSAKALEYARNKIEEEMIINKCLSASYTDNNQDKSKKWRYFQGGSYMSNFALITANSHSSNGYNGQNLQNLYDSTVRDGYIGLVVRGNTDSGTDDDNGNKSHVGVNVTNVFKAYLTYFTDFMNGVSKTDSHGKQVYDVNKQVSTSHLVDNFTKFTVKTGTKVASDDLGQATFYDALFNQICKNGWTENPQMNDNEYLQHMLQNGMMYISKMKDDGYYYQGNYATDTYIKEIADETKIAAAESKYNTQKAKLNAKEQTLDLKMKNLDTEISSLTTEYDTVKNTISKNVETAFKRYSA